ncbi:MAG: hypothetical protein JWR51_4668 [Devosia sp.]|uniref:hypothetical protein n=1 Tax=Devosia sp. TaxID=1871048 RepID=UPI00260F5948|nr:hypothetical protein [Devosia sp.]MDB5531565.1 hypothetical protein [Devosia sp.]
MTDWNFDISAAPRGHTETRTAKGQPYEAFVGDPIIVATEDGTVTLSQWLPKTERWEMLGKDEAPIAWQPWPKHPRDAS